MAEPKKKAKTVAQTKKAHLRTAKASHARPKTKAKPPVVSVAAESPPQAFSIRETLKGRTIFLVGGTGFLGRIMLYMFLKNVPDIKRIYMLIRPTHGQTGEDRLRREILESPVFTTEDGDREFFQRMAGEKITVVEGDASRLGMGVEAALAAKAAAESDLVLNTAGNVEFNPPLDLSLSANTLATKEALDFTEKTKGKRYVHISTCFVADRSVYSNTAPEVIVSDRVKSASGAQILVNPVAEAEEARATIERVKSEMESPEKMREYRDRARTELRKLGRSPDQERLVEKLVKNIKTYETREELIKAGKERAARLNRPNVYTYTKTLAELLVKSRSDKIQYTIVRPSIVEAALKTPFSGWNEGVQGSAPLIYLMHRGHRMIPSLSTNPDERADAVLDIIPVDLVAAGTISAAAALIAGRHKEIYQLAAGPIDHPLTATRILSVAQITLRDLVRDEDSGFRRFLRLNMQAYTVSKKTFETYSSPRTLKILTKVKDRLGKIDSDKLPKSGQTILRKVQGNVERFFNISVLKNKIFAEFMPFINHGYPVFQNQNGIDLWKTLPDDEKDAFFFDPLQMDFTTYLSDTHIPGVVEWVFPVLERRFQAINRVNREESGDESGWKTFSTLFTASDDEFRDRFRVMKDKAVNRFKQARDVRRTGRQDSARAKQEEREALTLKRQIEMLAGRDVKGLEHLPAEDLTRVADHLEFIYGHRLTSEQLVDLRSFGRLESHLERLRETEAKRPGPLNLNLPSDGLDVPGWLADPTRGFLYKLQMWFFDRVLNADIVGRENIPWNTSQVIVIANHCSHLDYGLIQYALSDYGRDIGIVAARDYFFDTFWKSTFFGNFMTLVPIERNETSGYAQAFKPALDYLNAGSPILIFPEGTRSADGVMQPFKHGLGWLAQKAQADVLPIRLTGTNKALPKGKTVLRGRRVKVEIGRPISYESLVEQTNGLSPTKSYDVITKRLQAAVRNIHATHNVHAKGSDLR